MKIKSIMNVEIFLFQGNASNLLKYRNTVNQYCSRKNTEGICSKQTQGREYIL